MYEFNGVAEPTCDGAWWANWPDSGTFVAEVDLEEDTAHFVGHHYVHIRTGPEEERASAFGITWTGPIPNPKEEEAFEALIVAASVGGVKPARGGEELAADEPVLEIDEGGNLVPIPSGEVEEKP